jgi:hypothetical protein
LIPFKFYCHIYTLYPSQSRVLSKIKFLAMVGICFTPINVRVIPSWVLIWTEPVPIIWHTVSSPTYTKSSVCTNSYELNQSLLYQTIVVVAMTPSVVGWKCSTNKNVYIDITLFFIMWQKGVFQNCKCLGKQNVTSVSTSLVYEIMGKWLSCHMLKNHVSDIWSINQTNSSHTMLDEYVRLVIFDKKILNWDRMILGHIKWWEIYFFEFYSLHLLTPCHNVQCFRSMNVVKLLPSLFYMNILLKDDFYSRRISQCFYTLIVKVRDSKFSRLIIYANVVSMVLHTWSHVFSVLCKIAWIK